MRSGRAVGWGARLHALLYVALASRVSASGALERSQLMARRVDALRGSFTGRYWYPMPDFAGYCLYFGWGPPCLLGPLDWFRVWARRAFRWGGNERGRVGTCPRLPGAATGVRACFMAGLGRCRARQSLGGGVPGPRAGLRMPSRGRSVTCCRPGGFARGRGSSDLWCRGVLARVQCCR